MIRWELYTRTNGQKEVIETLEGSDEKAQNRAALLCWMIGQTVVAEQQTEPEVLQYKDGKWVEATPLEFQGGLKWKMSKLWKRLKDWIKGQGLVE